MKKIIASIVLITSASAFAQVDSSKKETPAPHAEKSFSDKMHERYVKEGLKIYLSNDSSQWLKATTVAQVWVRNDWNNPGSTVAGYAQGQTQDIGIRRLRFQLFGYVAKRVFVYAQFGMNNFNYLAPRKQGAFFHDVVGEYVVCKKYLSLGAGLSTFGGPLRYSAPGVGSIMMADAPIYQQTTNDQTDQFTRKLGMYAKGQIGRFDYRIAVSKPFAIQTMVPSLGTPGAATFDTTMSVNAKFTPQPPELQYQGYFKWHFLDKESNDLPYNTGSYNGKKHVLTLGAGFQWQKNAMRFWDSTSASAPTTVATTTAQLDALNKHTVYHDLLIVGVDLFYDTYLNKEKGNAISAYGAWSYADYGQNYLRYNGVMNMNTGNNNVPLNNKSSYGNAFPMMGSGNTEFLQVGYKFKNNLLKDRGTLQPYIGVQASQYQALQYNNMVMAEMGVNWLISGNHRISLNYQSRPVFQQDPVSKNYVEIQSARRGMLYLQYQISL
ncbi:MAG TPA: hypothetical protein VNZ49_04065 [Bacteroidia bacterium]|jgi:hypothetical protein|nr:hypothetical protein [Bacteroidia bacterium]